MDDNNNGVIDPEELQLLDHRDALDALTGGLLYVSMTQYYARFHETLDDLNDLNHVVSLIASFIGVVSSTHEAEYLDGTAFAVMPGGLLIDMKGVQFNGVWENDAPETFANNHFFLAGHIGSALEHEIWQELTGFDAVSTVRGIQLALAQDLDNNGSPDATLLKIKNDGIVDTLPAAYSSLGFNSTAPSPFSIRQRSVFSHLPTSWAGSPGEFITFKGTVSGADSSLVQSSLTYNASNGVDGFVACIDSIENQLLTFPASTSLNPFSACSGSFSGTAGQVLAALEAHYNSIVAGFNQSLFDYLNRSLEFVPDQWVYRSTTFASDLHETQFIRDIRANNYFTTGGRIEYVLPSRLTVGDTYRFSVYIRKEIVTPSENIASIGFIISNKGVLGNGGYLDFSSIDGDDE